MSASNDKDLMGVGIIGDRIRLREACRRVYTAISSLQLLDISQGISTNRPGLEGGLFLFSSSFGRNNGNCQKKRRSKSNGAAGISYRSAADHTWTGQFICLSDIHAKKMYTSTEKVVLQKAGLGFKKIKFDLEAVEVLVHNQLTSSSFGNSQPGELMSGYSQLQNLRKNVYIVIKSTLSMHYALVSCHAYLPIICYQMTVMNTVTLSVTIAALKFLLVQKIDNMMIIYSYKVKIKKIKSCCQRRTTKFSKRYKHL